METSLQVKSLSLRLCDMYYLSDGTKAQVRQFSRTTKADTFIFHESHAGFSNSKSHHYAYWRIHQDGNDLLYWSFFSLKRTFPFLPIYSQPTLFFYLKNHKKNHLKNFNREEISEGLYFTCWDDYFYIINNKTTILRN